MVVNKLLNYYKEMDIDGILYGAVIMNHFLLTLAWHICGIVAIALFLLAYLAASDTIYLFNGETMIMVVYAGVPISVILFVCQLIIYAYILIRRI